MKIYKQVPSQRKAKAIISKVYEADRQGGLIKNGLGFSGSVLTAIATKNNDGYVVEISSGYFTETTLNEIVN